MKDDLFNCLTEGEGRDPLCTTEISSHEAAELLKRSGIDLMIIGSRPSTYRFFAAHKSDHSIAVLVFTAEEDTANPAQTETTVWKLTGATEERRRQAVAKVRATFEYETL